MEIQGRVKQLDTKLVELEAERKLVDSRVVKNPEELKL